MFADVANSGNKLHWAIWDIPATVPGITSSSTTAQIETAVKNASTGNVKVRGN